MTSRALYLAVVIFCTAFLLQKLGKAQELTAATSPEMERLARALVGDWNTVETMEPGDEWPRGASREGTAKVRLASGGYTLVYETRSDGSAGKLDGFLTIWWDKDAKLYYFVACFNHPDSPCHMRGTAHWEGERFVNDYEVMVDGKKTPCHDTFSFTPGDHKLVASMDIEGVTKTMITTDARRVTGASHATAASVEGGKLSAEQFNGLMKRLERAWNLNDAKGAADCFTDDAVYSAPPSERIRRGRAELFAFFGGERGRPRPMHMEWHHLVFDEGKQIGAGEYTFSYDIQTHGMVIIKIRDGRIANWREYEQESAAGWEEAVGANKF